MTAAGGGRVDHRLLEYGSEAEFIAGVVPFLFDGIEAGEPGLVVVPAGKIATLRHTLGSAAGERVRFADSDSWGSGNVPARVLAVELIIRKLLATAVRCRYVGEFTWQGDAQRR
ncbi:MAG: MEDS domain-containing protein, partial [Pseudonocardiaceae bacterium]